jgi:hypothetical protein
MPTRARRKTLTAAQARAWVTAEVALAQAKAAVDAALVEVAKLRERYEDRLEPSDDPADADKNVKVARAGGWQIRFTRFAGAERFSLKSYRDAGLEVTPEMAAHITPGSEQVRVTVKRLAGPTKPGAVEVS